MSIFWWSIITAAFVSFFPIPSNPKVLKLMANPPTWIFSCDGYTNLFKKATGPYIEDGAPVVVPDPTPPPTPTRRQSVRPNDRPLPQEIIEKMIHLS